MKIVITGSLGRISRPLAIELVRKGHQVTVISSQAVRQKEIEALGARAAIGTIEDVAFLTQAFTGADVVYCMEPPFQDGFFDPNFDLNAHIERLGHIFVQAIKGSGVKRVVHLSSIGAHMAEGNGILAMHYSIEKILNTLPADVSITFMRPVGFYYNIYAFIPTIKAQGAIISNYGGDDKEPWVAPADIAAAIAEEMETPHAGRKIRYVASDELSPNELAALLGGAIGQPGLKWISIPDEQMIQGMVGMGMSPKIAKGFVEMNASRRGGVLYEDYNTHKPALGKIKLTDFAKEFAAAYNK
jgi:uncharacterized protein YbjT (DUF2867 family)